MFLTAHYFILLFGLSAGLDVELRVYLGSFDNYTTTSLDQPKDFLPSLNPDRSTLFYTFGLENDPYEESVRVVVESFLSQYNVVLVDWTKEAQNQFGTEAATKFSYWEYNAPMAEKIGCEVGKALVTLINDDGLDVSRFFLMGHSLGAHLMGAAGRCAMKLGQTIDKIIGLDPAGPDFTTTPSVLKPLDRSCAKHVMIIHTDPEGSGTYKATGHVDFFPNYSSGDTMQPGCAEGQKTQSNTTCDHSFAWMLMSASVNNSDIFPAMYATDGDAWLAGLGNLNNVAYINVYGDPKASGSYFLRTGKEYPYGLGKPGMYPENNTY